MTILRNRNYVLGNAVLLFAMSLSLLLAPNVSAGEAPRRPIDVERTERVYPYTMKGKVRILFFWIGKDDVGGGHISLTRMPADDAISKERIEVLFGSKPERVPGRHNRWGYAFETSYWRASSSGAPPELERTLLEGFMRRSKESSMSELQTTSSSENAAKGYAFKGTRSEVSRTRATAEIRFFTTAENFDYRHAAPIREGYEERLDAGPPDKLTTLDNDDGYRAPYGFLSATRHLLQRVVVDFQQNQKRWDRARPSEIYVYNAKRFRLRIKDIDHKKTFRVGSKSSTLPPLHDVASVEFRIEELGTRYKHDFTAWIPLRGELVGIPVRIVDKPRWWLRVELELAPDAKLLTVLKRSRNDRALDEEN